MKIKTLTPVHIGSGDRYMGLDFIIKGNKVIMLDLPNLFRKLEEDGKNVMKIIGDLRSKKTEVEDLVEDVESFKLKEIPFEGENKREILKHVQSLGKPYIPGSSVKGAIRTALLWKAVRDDQRLLNWTLNYIKNLRGRINPRKVDDALETKVFRLSGLLNRDDPKNDLLRALKVTDSGFFENVKIYEVKYLNARSLSVCAECIDAGDSAEIDVEVDEIVLSYLEQRLDFDGVKEATREFARAIVDAELARAYPERTKREFRNVLNNRGILLRIGWGIGWFSTTIGTLLKSHPDFEEARRKLRLGRGAHFPVTRRVAWDDRPLGWVSIDG